MSPFLKEVQEESARIAALAKEQQALAEREFAEIRARLTLGSRITLWLREAWKKLHDKFFPPVA